jgi:hypothetical protein
MRHDLGFRNHKHYRNLGTRFVAAAVKNGVVGQRRFQFGD